MPLALLGFPSVEEVVRKVVDLVFGALSQALLPDFLRDGTVDAINWLIAVPNPANSELWPNVARLEQDMAALGFGLLGLTFVVAAVRYTLAGVTGGPHPLIALAHAVGATGALVAYHWAFANAVALVNTITHEILVWPVVAQGLGRTVKVLFGGSLLVGSGSVFLSLLALVAIFFAVSLFVMKVAVLMLAAILYVAGPAVIGLYPLPEAARFTRLWLYAAIAVVLVPLGWCVIFATAGALALDVTSFGDLGSQGTASVVGAKTTGAFAGLLMFAFAAVWPFKLSRHLGGLPGPGARPAPTAGSASIGAGRVRAAQARLRAGAMAGGAVLGRAAGAAGAPRGGVAGVVTRRGSALRTRFAGPSAGARPGSADAGSSRSRASSGHVGTSETSPRSGVRVAERARAVRDVVREGPREIREAVAAAQSGDPGRRADHAPSAGARSEGASERRRPMPGSRAAAKPGAAGAEASRGRASSTRPASGDAPPVPKRAVAPPSTPKQATAAERGANPPIRRAPARVVEGDRTRTPEARERPQPPQAVPETQRRSRKRRPEAARGEP